MSETLGVGVIGTGGMGARHALNMAHHVPGARVAAVMDVDQSRAQETALRCGNARVYDDAKALIADNNVDAVVITSPDDTHASLCMQCISSGKPTLCEKPLAPTAEVARAVVEAEMKVNKRLVQLGFMREYDPAHERVRAVVRSGELGRALVFRGVHMNLANRGVRTLHDVVSNSAVHDVHSARFMMPGEIETVKASHIPVANTGDDTCRYVLIELRYDDGALGVIQCNADAGYAYEVDVEITCETGVVQTNGLSSPSVKYGGAQRHTIEADWLARFDDAYLLEAKAWVQAALNGAAVGPSAWDGYASLLVTDKCIASALSASIEHVVLPSTPSIYANA